jgi:hypothetical protein
MGWSQKTAKTINTQQHRDLRVMKKILLLFLISFMINESKAQVFCDSTYMECDSLSIDSAFIIQTNNSFWLMFEVTVNNQLLYAPTFVLCTSSDNPQFVDTSIGFTGIAGPSTTTLHYVFQDFSFPIGDEIAGEIVVDNSNNSNNNCTMPFSITVNEPTVTEETRLENSVEISPNPANDHLVVKLQNDNDEILKVQLFNLSGIKQNIYFFDNTINLSGVIPGYYTLHLELSNGQRIIQKIIKE